MSALPAKINCKLCGARISNIWETKWRHVIQKHPDAAMRVMLPLMLNPARAFDLGRKAAERAMFLIAAYPLDGEK